jgi:ATP/maltotriose-dependent transcriptional regulator MalT
MVCKQFVSDLSTYYPHLWITFQQGCATVQIEIRGLEKLSFRERQAVILKESGKSFENIAKQLHLSQSSVATLLARARSKGYEIVCIIPGGELGLGGGELDEEGPSED